MWFHILFWATLSSFLILAMTMFPKQWQILPNHYYICNVGGGHLVLTMVSAIHHHFVVEGCQRSMFYSILQDQQEMKHLWALQEFLMISIKWYNGISKYMEYVGKYKIPLCFMLGRVKLIAKLRLCVKP